MPGNEYGPGRRRPFTAFSAYGGVAMHRSSMATDFANALHLGDIAKSQIDC